MAKQRQTRRSRRGERAAARFQQSSSTSSEREREASWKPKPQRASTTCTTPSCQGFVHNDRINKELHYRYCGQAFASTASAQQPSKLERQKLLALAARLRAVGDTQTAERLEEIAPAQEAPGPSCPSRLLKAWNASKNAVAQKTNQHAAMVAKVARWTVELAQAKHAMLDLAVELHEAEQAERKERASYETASAILPEEFDEIMDVESGERRGRR